jgi:hypothetical protein
MPLPGDQPKLNFSILDEPINCICAVCCAAGDRISPSTKDITAPLAVRLVGLPHRPTIPAFTTLAVSNRRGAIERAIRHASFA